MQTPKPKRGQEFELIIEKTAFKGKGIGYIPYGDQRLVTFVRKAVPQDHVRVRVVAVKRKHAEAEIIDFIEESPLRIAPQCSHFTTCGGCSWQNVSYETQLSFKEQHVRESLDHVGGLQDVPVRSIIPCDSPFYYRNKVELSFGDNSDEDFVMGFHVPGRRYDIFNLNECYLQSELMAKIKHDVFAFFAERDIPFYRKSKGEGILESLFIKESKTNNQFMLILKVRAAQDTKFEWEQAFADHCQAIHGSISSVFLTIVTSKRGQRTQQITRLLSGEPHLVERLTVHNHAHDFAIGPDSFFQPNPRQAEKLYGCVIDALKICSDAGISTKVLVDLYCGLGSISLFVSHYADYVYGLELVAAAIRDAKENATRNNITNCTFIEGDVCKTIEDIDCTPEIIVTDPPRAGMEEKVVKKIIDIGPKALIYVSCNPTTLARDLALFRENGYKIEYVQPVDMFPQTYHSENVALLMKA